MSKIINKTDYVWKWYLIIQDYDAVRDSISQKEFCRLNNIKYTELINNIYKINYKKFNNPDLYRKLIDIDKGFAQSPLSLKDYSLANGINPRWLHELHIHFGHLEIIETRLKALGKELPPIPSNLNTIESKPISTPESIPETQSEEKPMTFFKVPVENLTSIQPISHSGEIIEKQNDIEITISQGVKVSISPNIDSMKIIKIIELLKDL